MTGRDPACYVAYRSAGTLILKLRGRVRLMEKSAKVYSARKRKVAGQGPEGRDEVPSVGRVLRRARVHHGLSIREVERRIGRSSAYLSQIERGLIRHPDPVVLLELAELYKLDFLSLATWAGWMGEKDQDD